MGGAGSAVGPIRVHPGKPGPKPGLRRAEAPKTSACILFTIIALSIRLADHLKGVLGRG
jgi:hypothetical protein